MASDLHPLTLKSIEENDCYCGVVRKPCSYHEGFEDGIDAMQERLDEARAAPEDMTPEKLRLVAGWLDTYDRLFKKIVVREPDGTVKSAREVTGLGYGDWNEVQTDLRRWADELARIDGGEKPNG